MDTCSVYAHYPCVSSLPFANTVSFHNKCIRANNMHEDRLTDETFGLLPKKVGHCCTRLKELPFIYNFSSFESSGPEKLLFLFIQEMEEALLDIEIC